MQIGMIRLMVTVSPRPMHRQSRCGPNGPAGASVPPFLAGQTDRPLGMTPLPSPSLQAAQQLRFSEQAATVVLLHRRGGKLRRRPLVRLGADAGRQQGIDFTAPRGRVRMTDADQCARCRASPTRRAACSFAANDADDLARALPRDDHSRAPSPPGPTLRDGQHHAPRHRGFWLRTDQQAPDRPLRRAATPGGTAPQGLAREQGDPTGDGHGGVLLRLLHRLYPAATRAGGHRPFALHGHARRCRRAPAPMPSTSVIGARLRLTAMAHSGLPMPPNGGATCPSPPTAPARGRAHFVVHPVNRTARSTLRSTMAGSTASTWRCHPATTSSAAASRGPSRARDW